MTNFRRGNGWRAAGALFGLFGFLAFMTLAPMAQTPDVDAGPEITVPTMRHVPVDGAFSVELR